MDFSDVLASAVHDIKNSLGMLLSITEELMADPHTGLAGNSKAVALQLEAQRANNDLIQLLTLYKLGNQRLTPHIVEHNLEDFLEEVLVEHRGLMLSRGIHIDARCDPLLTGYFDEDLVRGVLHNAIGNAERYTRDRLLLSADMEDGLLVLRVEDNGLGFPEGMLERRPSEGDEGTSPGRTQLGLYFSEQIAQLHRDRSRQGFIRLENHHRLAGGCFSIWLP